MDALLKFAQGTRRLLAVVALASGWLLVVMTAVTCFDVLARKLGLPVPLTKLQELEWHFHAAIFSLWMGYGYVINAHPRVDSFTEKLAFRRKAWIELFGCVFLALPYMTLAAYHAVGFVTTSYNVAEQSESPFGLTHRWIIKAVYMIGVWLVLVGILSVLARVIVLLFGRRSEAEVDLRIGSTTVEV